MVIHQSQNLVVCYVFFVFFFYFLLHFFISFKYDFHIDAERMIVKKTRDMKRNICVDGLKNNVWHDTYSVGKNSWYV